MSVADIISERALIQQRLLINPADAESALLLQQLDTKVCGMIHLLMCTCVCMYTDESMVSSTNYPGTIHWL